MWNFVDVVVFKITMFANLNKLKTMETNTNAIKEGSSLYLHPRGFFVLNIMDLTKYLSKMVRIVKLYCILKLELVNILYTYDVGISFAIILQPILLQWKSHNTSYATVLMIVPKSIYFCVLCYPSLLILALGV